MNRALPEPSTWVNFIVVAPVLLPSSCRPMCIAGTRTAPVVSSTIAYSWVLSWSSFDDANETTTNLPDGSTATAGWLNGRSPPKVVNWVGGTTTEGAPF